MMQIAICDDERYYRKKIKELVQQYLERRGLPYMISLFSSGEEFLEQRENAVKYDIVFMDINMSETDGIRTAERMRAFHSETYLVFVTAFINYVLEGYKVDAVRYIMKDTLDTAVEECMDAILQKMHVSQVSFCFLEGERKLYTDNILYVESRKHKVIFYYMESEMRTYEMYEKLDRIEIALDGYSFFRVHKSYLVNMKHLRSVNNYRAELDTGEELPIPRSKYQAVKEAFVAYKGAL
ncbi:MAG: response regulator transcription factor [Lachnospiraceae bacterium]|nr:response regulator transcription factor [Lachnospiraceae bacterium]